MFSFSVYLWLMRSDAVISRTFIDFLKRLDNRITGTQGHERTRDECERPFYTVFQRVRPMVVDVFTRSE